MLVMADQLEEPKWETADVKFSQKTWAIMTMVLSTIRAMKAVMAMLGSSPVEKSIQVPCPPRILSIVLSTVIGK